MTANIKDTEFKILAANFSAASLREEEKEIVPNMVVERNDSRRILLTA